MAAPPGDGGAPGAADPDAAPQARRLYDQGRAAAKAGDWARAYAAQRAAYARFPHWQIAGALGDAAFALGKYPESIEMLSESLREAKGLDAKGRADAEERLADAKGRCGKLSIEAPAGAELRVDGAPMGRFPLQKVVYVLPGPHTIEVAVPSGGVKQVVDVTAGKDVRLNTKSMAATPSPSGTAVTRMPAPATTAKPSMAPVVVLGTAAGLGAIAGAVLMGMSEVRKGEATRELAAFREGGKPCGEDPRCKTSDGLWADRQVYGSAALGVWIGAGIAGAAAVAVGVVQRRRQPAATATTWAPVVSTNGAGLVVSGSF